jgi:hypothetical protein
VTPKQLQAVVDFFAPLGFDVSVDKLLARSAKDEWIGSLAQWTPDPGDPPGFSDLNVLAFDPKRVWRLESYEILFDKSAREQGYAYCRSYAEVIERLAKISPFPIRATNTGKRGELDLVFARRKHRIRFRTDLSVFSTDVLRAVNEVIGPSGYRYAFLGNQYCTGFVVLLSDDDALHIVKRRKWKLEPL